MSSSNKGKEKISLRPLNPQKNDFDDTPLWNHVKVINLASGGGGNRVWSCNYCHKKVTGSYSKVKAHLLRLPGSGVTICNSISDDIAVVIKKEHEDAERKKANKKIRARRQADYLSLPPGTDLLQQKKRKPGALENAFNVADRDTADKLCARMFYACALPFNLVRSPQFRKYSLFLENSKLTGYIPPNYDRLRTTLLAQEKAHINVKVHHIKESWNKKGLSICSDGWSNIQRNPLINIMAASESGALFLSSTNASREVKDAEYVANIFIRAIEDVGPNNVVQVITDNASNYKAAGGIIELKYPHIFWTPCVVHSLNLALKRMCDPPENIGAYVHCAWISKLIADCQSIRNFIMNHDLAHAIFNNYSSLKLLKIAETRFASGIIMADRLSKVRKALESMIMDERWKTYKGDGKSVVDSKAREVKQCIVDDQWWDTLDYLLNLTRPIIDFIRVADTDSPILHLVYDMWDSMIEEIKTVVFRHEGKDLLVGQSAFFDAIHKILEERWNKSNTPLHCLAHSLVPKYYTDSWLKDGDGVQRLAPHEDQEVSMNRVKCFKRIFEDPNDLRKVCMEYGEFSSATGLFNDSFIKEARVFEEPISWWSNYGSSEVVAIFGLQITFAASIVIML
ncbi:Unknown protein [Striga hermonthica]|uniref:DUF659 domain-containing protein n=1 Tax=Striga hermonthica TaxID=68872 RepID=A0A9N7P0Y4_STRHE|nr:Unknown protein [Striga hermonthica]